MTDAQTEIEAGDRFGFGENWRSFLGLLDESRIVAATASLSTVLGVESLVDRRFLDVGSGSGLFSLAARRLGAEVVSFDFDPSSVACTSELRARYFPNDALWHVHEGSALDRDFLLSLGQFDIVYSWGVLHHTGSMWSSFANVAVSVRTGGRLFISIYNDQGLQSRVWLRVKRRYNASGSFARWGLLHAVNLWFKSNPRNLASRVRRRWVGLPTVEVPRERGMDRRHDLLDWVGGYPFEVAKPEEIFDFYQARGFRLDHLKTCAGGLACNEYVFTKER